MYVYPGKPFNFLVRFMAGADPVAPATATFRVIDADGVVVAPTSITLTSGQMEAWVTVSSGSHTLGVDEKYRQFRIEVSHVYETITFEQHYTYFVVPDLMLAFDAATVRSLVGLSSSELVDSDIDFARAYIDLAGGEYAEAFLDALNSTSNPSLVASAKQLILYHSLMTLMPTLRLKALKSIESETSKITRLSGESAFMGIERDIRDKYNMYLAIIKVAAGLSSSTSVNLLVLSNPTDPVTGA